jgi:probable phosphoglycerate mutase
LPLTERGEEHARRLGARLRGLSLDPVLTSPRQRAARTCELAGFGAAARVVRDFVEWNYGDYEGRTSAEIWAGRPDRELFRDGCPGRETPDQVGARADRLVGRPRGSPAEVAVFSSGHFLRVLVARWVALEEGAGRCLALDTASLSALGYERSRSRPVIRLWNESPHAEVTR